MKIYQKACSILIIVFSIVTFCLAILSLLNYVTMSFMMLSLGLTELFSGLNQISRAKQTDANGVPKGNRKIGLITLFVGIAAIVVFSIIIIVK